MDDMVDIVEVMGGLEEEVWPSATNLGLKRAQDNQTAKP